MRLKLKAVGLGLLALLATSAMAAVHVNAETGGHFTFGANPAEYEGFLGGEGHSIHFKPPGAAEGERIGCDNNSYKGSIVTSTETALTLTPQWSSCYTTGSPGTKFDIHEHECDFVLRVGKSPEKGHNTINIVCPGAGFMITHPNCSIRIPPQTAAGVSYKNILEDVHHVTATFTISNFTAHYHAGICIFLGTTQKIEMIGAMRIRGYKQGSAERVHFTATA